MPPLELKFIRLPGLVPYADALRIQKEKVRQVESGDAPDTIFLLEHEPVITLGRKAREENLLKRREELNAIGIAVHESDRGGDVTYHGPGQLVAYPILNLSHWKESIGWYLRQLEDVLIQQLAGYGLSGERAEGMTGVWVQDAKVAAIGIALHNWVTYHGIALNIAPNMAHFELIIPCGLTKPVTSLEKLMPAAPTMEAAMRDYETDFRSVFSE